MFSARPWSENWLVVGDDQIFMHIFYNFPPVQCRKSASLGRILGIVHLQWERAGKLRSLLEYFSLFMSWTPHWAWSSVLLILAKVIQGVRCSKRSKQNKHFYKNYSKIENSQHWNQCLNIHVSLQYTLDTFKNCVCKFILSLKIITIFVWTLSGLSELELDLQPTWQKEKVCFLVFCPRPLLGWNSRFWQWLWRPAYSGYLNQYMGYRRRPKQSCDHIII